MMSDSDSDSDLELISDDERTTQRRPPPTFTYGNTQRKATSPNTTEDKSSQSKGAEDKGDDSSSDEEEEELELPRSSGTVREVHDDEEAELPKSSGAAAPFDADLDLSPMHLPAYQEPPSRQKTVITHEMEESESQEHSDPAPASDSQPDVFGAFFEDTQPFDASQHGTKADIDIFAHPASTFVPRTFENDGDETRVDNGFDHLRRAQAELRMGSPDSFDALPSLPEPTLEEDNSDSMEDDELRAMEKQQLILQVERQRANALADSRPRLMHLNRDGLFTQTEPSQFLDDSQSQLFSQFSEPDHQPQQHQQPRMSSPAMALYDDDDFSEDSDHEQPPARIASSPPPPTQNMKRTSHLLSAPHVPSSSPLTPLPSEDTVNSTPYDRLKRKNLSVIRDSDDEEEQHAQPSPSPDKKRIKLIVASDDEEEDDQEEEEEAPRRRKVVSIAVDSDDEEADAEMSDKATEAVLDDEDDYKLDLKKLKSTKAPASEKDNDTWTDDEMEEGQRDEIRTATTKERRSLNQGTLSKFFGVPEPELVKEVDQPANQKKQKSAFIAGEAEESDDDERVPGKKSRKGGLDGVFSEDEDAAEEEDEDAEDDGKDLEGLVDDDQDEEQVEKDQLVAEKFKEDREAQDKADEELHTRATKGQLRKSRPGMGLENELDDDAQDDLDRRRIAQGPQKRKVNGEKDGLDDIQNTALAKVYKEDIRNNLAEEADFLNPVESETDSDDHLDTDQEDQPREAISSSAVRAALKAAALHRKGRKSNPHILSDDEDRTEEKEEEAVMGSDNEDGFGAGVHIRNHVHPQKFGVGLLDANLSAAGAQQQQQRPRQSGGRLNMREDDDGEKHAMDLLLGPRMRNEAEQAKLRRANEEFGETMANRRRFLGTGTGGGKQNNSSVTQFGQARRVAGGAQSGSAAGGGGGGGLGGGAAVMKAGLGHPSTRRGSSGPAAARSVSKLGTVLESNRVLKFKDSQ
ncbi:hypothetical protein CF326_g3351 [Tilletia indica]|nr:hypothetical protein CF326_g3351 [Tilletia indica]